MRICLVVTLRGSEVFECPNSSFLLAKIVLVRKGFISAIGITIWNNSHDFDDVDTHVTSDSGYHIIPFSDPPHIFIERLVCLIGSSDGSM